MEHEFSAKILDLLAAHFGGTSRAIFEHSPLIQYLNIKTKSATRGSKARSSFANLFAIYVLVEDYVKGGFDRSDNYSKYEGAKFSTLFARQRELPFGNKLQNHALNHRLNEEFKKYFPSQPHVPVLRDVATNRYWINENLLRVKEGNKKLNLAHVVLQIVDEYVSKKQEAFSRFIRDCEQIAEIQKAEPNRAAKFILGLLSPNVDARVFEIVSYAILRAYYAGQVIYWGWSLDEIGEENLTLFKTGRTNANDGGIDFVMRPLGRFFQVTETIDVRKYFLDIDKVQRYPITFIVKTDHSVEDVLKTLREHATVQYGIKKVVERYMESVEEIFNVQRLADVLSELIRDGKLKSVTDEIVIQSRVEFNIESD